LAVTAIVADGLIRRRAADAGTLVGVEDRLFEALHGLDGRELTIGD
jgi:hypothetical protein